MVKFLKIIFVLLLLFQKEYNNIIINGNKRILDETIKSMVD